MIDDAAPVARRIPRRLAPAWYGCLGFTALWAVLLGMVLTKEGLAEDDAPALAWVVGHRSAALTGFFGTVSSTGLDGGAALLAGGLVLVVAVRRHSYRPLLALGAAVAGAVVVAELVKDVVDRARPGPATMLGTPETGSGFPSAHTLVFAALAGAVALVVWRTSTSAGVRAAVVTVAAASSTAMGASRLYLGDHWLTDVLASYALAGVILTAVAALIPPRPPVRSP